MRVRVLIRISGRVRRRGAAFLRQRRSFVEETRAAILDRKRIRARGRISDSVRHGIMTESATLILMERNGKGASQIL